MKKKDSYHTRFQKAARKIGLDTSRIPLEYINESHYMKIDPMIAARNFKRIGGTTNRAGKAPKRPLSRAKKNVAARRRRKERQYAVPLAGSKTGGVGIATFQSRRQAAKYAEEIGVNPRSIRKNY